MRCFGRVIKRKHESGPMDALFICDRHFRNILKDGYKVVLNSEMISARMDLRLLRIGKNRFKSDTKLSYCRRIIFLQSIRANICNGINVFHCKITFGPIMLKEQMILI